MSINIVSSVASDSFDERYKTGSTAPTSFAEKANASSVQSTFTVENSLVFTQDQAMESGGWKPQDDDENPWIQYTVDESAALFYGVSFYACSDNTYITAFEASCVFDNSSEIFFSATKAGQRLFTITADFSTLEQPIFKQDFPIVYCPTVRVYPKSWHLHKCVKWRPEYSFGNLPFFFSGRLL